METNLVQHLLEAVTDLIIMPFDVLNGFLDSSEATAHGGHACLPNVIPWMKHRRHAIRHCSHVDELAPAPAGLNNLSSNNQQKKHAQLERSCK